MPAGYLEHLTPGDLRLLASAGGLGTGPGAPAGIRDAGALDRLLSDPRVFDRLFGRAAPAEPLLVASPFLVFAVAVNRAAADLEHATFVHERVKARQRVPVFDVDELRSFLDDPLRRFFLVELLASYTTVASGALWTRSSRGWRRHRFSELDPVRFAALLDVVPEQERPGVYRRLGDLALFLTGVFPDRTLTAAFGPVAMERLARTQPGHDLSDLRALSEADAGALGLLEELGRRWYRLASSTASPQTAALSVVGAVADQFRAARRVLNFVTDGYLFPHRGRWFPASAS
jgi:hypothetical protein